MAKTTVSKASKPKTLSVYFDDSIYGTAFFVGQKCTGYIHENDGYWSDYHCNILKPLGIKVKRLEELTEKQKNSLDKMCPGIFDE